MNPLMLRGLIYAGILMVVTAFLVSIYHKGYVSGVSHEKVLWDRDIAARQKAEAAAVAKRNAENVSQQAIQAENSRLITRKYDDEISALHSRLAAAPRLRVGPALCGGPSRPAPASGTSSSNEADTAGRVVPDDLDRDLKALMAQVEESLATARAAQQFIRDNGMSPPEK